MKDNLKSSPSSWEEKSDILYLKTDDFLWCLYKVRLVKEEETLEMLSTKSQEVTTVLLSDGFLCQAIRQANAERLNEFCIRGHRGELRLAASSLQARDDWLDKLECLKACRNKLRRQNINGSSSMIRRSMSNESSSPASTTQSFLDNRASARIDGVFGSYLYKKTRWSQWHKRYYLLLAEKGEIRRYNSALPEQWRDRIASTGDVPRTEYVYSLKAAKISIIDQNRFSLAYYQKLDTSQDQTKPAIKKKLLILDTRAPDLCRAWIRKLQAAIDLALRRHQENAELSRAIHESRNMPSPPRRAKSIIATPHNNDIQNAIAAQQTNRTDSGRTNSAIISSTRRPVGAGRRHSAPSVPGNGASYSRLTAHFEDNTQLAHSLPSPDRSNSILLETSPPDDTLVAIPIAEKEAHFSTAFYDNIDGPWSTISARSNGGRIVSCTLFEDALVADLRAMIHQNNPDLPPNRTKLLFHGQPLDDDQKRLKSDLNITDGTELFFVLRR